MPFLSTAKRCAPLYVSANTVSGPVWPRSKKSGCARARPSSLHWARQDPLRRLRGIRAQPTGARLRAGTAHLAHDRIPLPAGIQRASASATSGWPRPPVPCRASALPRTHSSAHAGPDERLAREANVTEGVRSLLLSMRWGTLVNASGAPTAASRRPELAYALARLERPRSWPCNRRSPGTATGRPRRACAARRRTGGIVLSARRGARTQSREIRVAV